MGGSASDAALSCCGAHPPTQIEPSGSVSGWTKSRPKTTARPHVPFKSGRDAACSDGFVLHDTKAATAATMPRARSARAHDSILQDVLLEQPVIVTVRVGHSRDPPQLFSVPRRLGDDRDELPGFSKQRFLRQTGLAQHRYREGRESPGRHLSVHAFHVEIHVGMRIDPVHLRYRPLQRQRLRHVELAVDRMMRQRHRHRGQHEDRGEQKFALIVHRRSVFADPEQVKKSVICL